MVRKTGSHRGSRPRAETSDPELGRLKGRRIEEAGRDGAPSLRIGAGSGRGAAARARSGKAGVTPGLRERRRQPGGGMGRYALNPVVAATGGWRGWE